MTMYRLRPLLALLLILFSLAMASGSGRLLPVANAAPYLQAVDHCHEGKTLPATDATVHCTQCAPWLPPPLFAPASRQAIIQRPLPPTGVRFASRPASQLWKPPRASVSFA